MTGLGSVCGRAQAGGPRQSRVFGWLHAAAGCALLLVAGRGAESVGTAPDQEKIAIALGALSRLKGIDLAANPSVKAAVHKVLEQVHGRPEFVEIVRDFQLTDQESGLLEVAVKNPRDSSGVEAARLLLERKSFDVLREGLESTNAVNLAEAVGHAQLKESIPLLEPIVADTRRDLNLRREAVRALAQVQEGAARLLTLARERKLPDDLKLAATAELNAARWPDIKAEAGRLLPLPKSLNSQPLPPISELITRRGNPVRGSEVFRRETVGCIRCHLVNGQGIDFGPNLSEIGSKLGADALYQAILDPSAGISFGYEAWQFYLKSGDEIYGLVSSETADEVAVKAVGGIVSRYKKSEIARRTQQKLSVMPSGLEQSMTLQDLVDLVEYLGTLRKNQ
jgi:putative heme-binding domain-containing protein